MPKTLKLAEIFRDDAAELLRARDEAIRIHGNDIRAAGNHVEVCVRDYLKRMLPPRYYVTTGHLIDPAGNVSPQIDVIIADNFNIPSLLTVRDGTEYIPITSVLAIGEVKSTYYKAKKYYENFHRVLSSISADLARPLVENSAHGEALKGDTTFRDMVLGSPNKYLNNLYSFILCIDGGDFNFADLAHFLKTVDRALLPNTTVLLNSGIVAYAAATRQRFELHKYPNEVTDTGYDWCFFQGASSDGGSLEGMHLAFLYGQLIQHLSSSHLEPPNAYPYTAKITVARKSSLLWARGQAPEQEEPATP